MKIVCVIDSLGSGGAQRQLVTLGVFLKQLGHRVSFVTYHKDDFFGPVLRKAGIEVESLGQTMKLQRPFALRKSLQRQAPDAVIAFLEGPCLYSELAGLPSRKWGLVVSERLQINSQRLFPDWKRLFHHLADYVTANSHATRLALTGMMPRLAGRIATIYNCLDLTAFRPAPPGEHASAEVRLLVVGSYQPRKNTLALVRALDLVLKKHPKLPLRIDCYGGFMQASDGSWDMNYYQEIQNAIQQFHLQSNFRLHERDVDIVTRYHGADAVLLPSLVEGLPNAVCEGMACGLGVLASRIGDAEVLVQEGLNGFLFDPRSPADIAEAIVKFCALSPMARAQMGAESRKLAESLFAPSSALQAYAMLLEAAAARRAIRLPHWPPQPSTAARILDRSLLETATAEIS